ncbi:PAS domain-containing hybrid sensor histidine kinase/response regulator [Halomonas heilongjiangensis]|uniref:histidine kinase n=1 Tax=Halomonas heilongjiangensis TaxID=1387883 RepID=A0A2N7TLF4_9GAMM|nr:ATP-binding protein [Halomonas heilongjiangensis]PMR69010.1 hybrid sensor histidine kinase/response regulator [Halomonas heilongjiangensis]PXX90032.1 hybrid sensor histidine kinase/response regulator [Halomonas heilongjiangensis]
MKKPSDPGGLSVSDLIGLGSQSARKSYYPELTARMAELEAERNRYKWLFENALHGIFQASLAGGVRAANPALARMLGDDSVDATQARCTTLAALFVDPEDAAELQRRVVAEGRVVGYTTRLRGQRGRDVPVAMTLVQKPSSDDEPLVEAFVADITEREQARQRLMQLNEQLEGRVQERTEALERVNAELRQEIAERRRMEAELREARDAAEQANRSKDRYLAAASHDLLQPMNAARLLVATLLERPLDGEVRDLSERIHLSLEGAEDLLTDLLDIARLDHDRIQPQPETFALRELIASLEAEFVSLAGSRGLTFRHRVAEAWVVSDFRLLGRVLRNFLSNACRYTRRGGVLLGTRRRGDTLWIEVWDSGPGIPADQRRAIFREFHQLGTSRARDRQGVGLGLAIVERIVTRLGHQIEVRSWPGQGSCFAVGVPLGAAAGPRHPPAASVAMGHDLAGGRALVVDNEPSILSSMQGLLEGWGMHCDLAFDAGEARVSPPPDVLLVDLHLDDGLTGDVLIQRLRDHWQCPLLPAVIITADRSDHWIQRLRAANLPVLNKPLKPGKLRAVLSQLLAQAH